MFQFYALNVQVIGNEEKLIYNLVSRWAGSTHDARIWANSAAKGWIEDAQDFLLAGKHLSPLTGV